MRMRIAGAHHLAAILKNLNMLDTGDGCQFASLDDPGANDFFDFGCPHSRQGQVVARQEAHHSADATLGLRNQQAFILKVEFGGRRIFL